MKSCLQRLILIALVLITSSLQADTKKKVHLSPQEQAWIDKHSEVVVGFTAEFPPALIKAKDDSYHGFE